MNKCVCGCGQLTNKTYKTGHWARANKDFRNRFRKLVVPPNPSGKCFCGCGKTTPLAKHTNLKLGLLKGSPTRFIIGHWGSTPQGQAAYRSHEIKVIPPNPSGRCMCGCGQITSIATRNSVQRFLAKGHYRRYVKGHSKKRLGEAHPSWKGGRIYNSEGYVMLCMPSDPRADKKGYVREHRVVWEQANGRSLRLGEQIHHINGIKDDNRPENLVALTSQEHRAEHREQQREIIRRQRERDPDFSRRGGIKGAAVRWKNHIKH